MDELRKKLDENIPVDVIDQREAWKGGPKLSYLSAAYAIDRANQVFGHLNWGYEIAALDKVFEGKDLQDRFVVSYIAKIRLSVVRPGDETKYRGEACYEDVGYGGGMDKSSQGKAHELAVKEAVSDGIKRALKSTGRSMGLGLYFKDGQYISHESVAVPVEKAEASTSRPKNLAMLRKSIQLACSTLIAQKKTDKASFVRDILGGAKTDDLDESGIDQVISKLRTQFPEIKL